MQKVIYFHGYGSSSSSEKAVALSFNYYVEAPTIPVKYDDALVALTTYLTSTCTGEEVFVGTSLGGYWACKMAEKIGCPAVLINPSCSPSKTLGVYGNPALTADELAKYPDLIPRKGGARIVLLAKDDAVIDHTIALNLFSPVCQVKVFEKGGHRFSDINTISENIDELLSHSFYLP